MPIISGSSQVDNGTVVTIPPDTSWIGNLAISARSIPTSASPYIEVIDAGGNVQPPTGTKMVTVSISNQTTADSQSVDPVYIETGATPAILRLRYDGITGLAVGIANGYGA